MIASEILEHVPADDAAIAELVRVLKPGGALAVTVPRWLPERICWALSDDYHANEGGHIRIYRADELRDKVLAPACGSPTPTTRTPCTRRTGGSNALSGRRERSTPRWRRTTSCWSGT